MAKKEMQQDTTKADVTRWLERITVSRKWRENVEQTAGWKRFIDEYKGKYDVVLGDIAVPPVNEVYSYVQSSIALLYTRDPYLAVNAKKSGTVKGSYILEAALNYYWTELNVKPEIQKEIVDAILVGHAWNKTGVNVRMSGSGDQMHLESDRMYSNRVSWKDVFFDVSSLNPPNDCRWIAHRIYMPVDQIKKMFGQAAATVQGSASPVIKEDTYRNLLFKDDVSYGCIYEIFSAVDRMIYVVADEVPDQYLAEPRPWPEHWESYPFDLLQFNPINDEAYGLSDIAPWEPQILEKIKVLTMALNHVKRWNRQMLIKKASMSPEDMDKYEKGIDGSMLEVNGEPATMTRAIDYGSLPPDIYLIIDRLDSIKRNVNGLPETFQGGQMKTQTRTLGELEAVQGGAIGRIQRKIDVIETHIESIARKLLANIMRQFPLETAVKITGKEPPEIIEAFAAEGRYDPVSQTITFTSEDIKGEYDVSVKAGSTLPLDKGTRDQILDRLIEMAIPLSQASSIPPFLEVLITERLKAYDIVSLEDAFKEQQEQIQKSKEQESESQSIQDQKMIAEAEKRLAQAQQIETETDISRAGAMAKAAGIIHPEAKL